MCTWNTRFFHCSKMVIAWLARLDTNASGAVSKFSGRKQSCWPRAGSVALIRLLVTVGNTLETVTRSRTKLARRRRNPNEQRRQTFHVRRDPGELSASDRGQRRGGLALLPGAQRRAPPTGAAHA